MVQNEKTYESKELLKRFFPYFEKYKFVLFMDLFSLNISKAPGTER